jgi:hypothetical protein
MIMTAMMYANSSPTFSFHVFYEPILSYRRIKRKKIDFITADVVRLSQAGFARNPTKPNREPGGPPVSHE